MCMPTQIQLKTVEMMETTVDMMEIEPESDVPLVVLIISCIGHSTPGQSAAPITCSSKGLLAGGHGPAIPFMSVPFMLHRVCMDESCVGGGGLVSIDSKLWHAMALSRIVCSVTVL